MRTTIDRAGRIVIPKSLREHVGLVPGEVEITVVGSALHIEPPTGTDLAEEDGRAVIPPAGARIDDALVRALRHAGQR